jgi:hypothetical protein
MNYFDVPDVSDYGAAIDQCERDLRTAINRRNAAMTLIEAARHHGLKLSTDEYIDLKIVHGNEEYNAHKFAYCLENYGFEYYTEKFTDMLRGFSEMSIRKPTLAQVWQQWRAFQAACIPEEEIKHEVTSDCWGGDKIMIKSRKSLDAWLAVQSAALLYAHMTCAFEGRKPPTWQQMVYLKTERLKRPMRAEPPPRRRATDRRRRAASERASANWE